MNILQLTNKVPYPPIDGGAIATINLSKGFAEQGHQVTILAMNTTKHYCEISSIPTEITSKINIIGVDVKAKITRTAALNNLFFSKLPYNAQRFLSSNYKEALIKLLTENKFDVIQLEGLYLGLYIPVIRQYSNAIISMRAHNIEHEIWHRTAVQEKNPLKKGYLKNLSKRIKNLKLSLINQYDVLVPITTRDARRFSFFGNKMPIHVSPTGINTNELISDRTKIEYPSVFHLGALDWAPNQEGLIWFLKDVWGDISKKHPTVKFYLAGRNAPAWLKQTVKSYENIEFLGEVDDACKFMNSGAIMIVPLLSGSGMRIKIIEGMALGKTIVSTAIGTEGISTTNNENILIANNAGDFINQIDTLLKDKKFFDEIGINAVNFVKENFDNLAISKDLIDFYKSNIK